MAVASSSTLGHLMEAALEAYFKYNSKQLFSRNISILFYALNLNYLFIIDYTTLFFSNGRRSTYMGVSTDGSTVRSTASTAVRICTGIRGKIASPLLRITKETSILQRHSGGRHASD